MFDCHQRNPDIEMKEQILESAKFLGLAWTRYPNFLRHIECNLEKLEKDLPID